MASSPSTRARVPAASQPRFQDPAQDGTSYRAWTFNAKSVRRPCDLTQPGAYEQWEEERVDTILCSNVLEHLEPDEAVLRSFYCTLAPGGHCVLVVPAGQWLYTGIDRELGHYRRYSRRDLASKMEAAGFEVVHATRFSRLGSLAWAASGHILRRRHLSPRQMVWFDRLLPLAKMLDWVLPVPGMSLIMVGRKPGRVSRIDEEADGCPATLHVATDQAAGVATPGGSR
jgi:SAM-dependent methyltransferase